MDKKIAVVGLGYVGLPVAVSFSKKYKVTGFDINKKRIEELKLGYDRTNEVCEELLNESSIVYTSDKDDLKEADFIIVAVPTPINKHKQPDLSPLISASNLVGSILKENTIIVYESTVFPGATEEICIPALEQNSKLKAGENFHVGYSPERVNPGDKEHTFETITKVVSAQSSETLDIIADVYGSVITAGIHKATNIKVAEAAKVIENTQRDVNIALMNELALIFERAGIDTKDVLEAASTKWNFLKFSPGLVGGHCIGVDPYYLTHKAQELGLHPEIILAGRRINDNMSKHIASSVIKSMLEKGFSIADESVNILGLSFKENTPDLRNTKVVEIISELESYGLIVNVHDPQVDANEAKEFYDINLKKKYELKKQKAIILAVAHKEYIENKTDYLELVSEDGIIFDLKGIINNSDLKKNQSVWRL
jgi:UDP-N-acetyl-D-galactosamine dehydrogenase